MANVKFNSDLSIPKVLNEDIHEMLQCFGYRLKDQDHFTARYEKDAQRIVFDSNVYMYQLRDDNGICKTQFITTVYREDMTDVDVMMLLDISGAIDITKSFIYREVFGTAFKDVEKLPGTEHKRDGFMLALEEVKAYNISINTGMVKKGAVAV